MTKDAIQEIMEALGPADDDLMAVLRMSESEWLLRYAEADVEVTFVEEESRLVFSASCGAPPAYRAAAVNAALLRFNAIWPETGSVRMALAGLGNEALLLADIFAAQTSKKQVGVIARNVAERAAAWRLVVEAGAPDEAQPLQSDIEATFFRA